MQEVETGTAGASWPGPPSLDGPSDDAEKGRHIAVSHCCALFGHTQCIMCMSLILSGPLISTDRWIYFEMENCDNVFFAFFACSSSKSQLSLHKHFRAFKPLHIFEHLSLHTHFWEAFMPSYTFFRSIFAFIHIFEHLSLYSHFWAFKPSYTFSGSIEASIHHWLITLIKCLKGHKSLWTLCDADKMEIQKIMTYLPTYYIWQVLETLACLKIFGLCGQKSPIVGKR